MIIHCMYLLCLKNNKLHSMMEKMIVLKGISRIHERLKSNRIETN